MNISNDNEVKNSQQKKQDSSLFEKNYTMLNDAQRDAVDTIEGPVMVVAGPGTGKTQILSVRIANILHKTDAEPENILALTFTEAAAANMRSRLARMIGPTAYRVVITTFHSFANDIIQNNPDAFPHIIGATAMTPVEQVTTIEEILSDDTFEFLKPFGDMFFYVRPLLSAINTLKREGVTPEKFTDAVAKAQSDFKNIEDLYHEKGAHKSKMKGKYQTLEKKINKNNELAGIYGLYQEKLLTLKKYDFTDMIMQSVEALKGDENLLLELQETHQYVLVDEHQDTNNAQNMLLDLLMSFHDEPNLFVVGDHKQSIFRFQGADAANFEFFKNTYSTAKMVILDQNYRSTQNVLDASDNLIAGHTPLQSNKDEKHEPLDVWAFPNSSSELNGIVLDIKKKIEAGVEGHEIALLYRNNRDADALSRTLSLYDIPHAIESDVDILDSPIALMFINLIRSVVSFGDDEVLSKLLYMPIFKIDPFDATRIIRAAYQKRSSTLHQYLKNIDTNISESERVSQSWESFDAIKGFWEKLMSWNKKVHTEDAIPMLENMVRTSGLLEYILRSRDPRTNMKVLQMMYDQVFSIVSSNNKAQMKDILQHFDTLTSQGMRISMRTNGATQGHVRLMTAHRSKGLEFEYVYIVHAHDGNWGNKKMRNVLPLIDGAIDGTIAESDALEDERRLIYVALTRAQKHVVMSYAKQSREGRLQNEAVFVAEIQERDEKLLRVTEKEEILISLETLKNKDEKDALENNPSIADQQKLQDERKGRIAIWVRDVFFRQGLSVSALNNYLKDPWQFFFRNLVRVPSTPNRFQAYGIAVHAVLQDLFENLNKLHSTESSEYSDSSDEDAGQISDEEIKKKAKTETSLKSVLKRFEYHLQSQTIAEVDYTDAYEKGVRALTEWYKAHHKVWNTKTINEMRINGVIIPFLSETQELLDGNIQNNSDSKSIKKHDGIRLTGVLDKIEILESEGSHTSVCVVDYKTGKARTRNDIMGNTKSSNGDYHRQLVFYKLLLSQFRDGMYKMTSGTIDFVEPDTKGKLHREVFELEDVEVIELTEAIRKSVHEILSLSFWDVEPDPKKCDYADLVPMIKNMIFTESGQGSLF